MKKNTTCSIYDFFNLNLLDFLVMLTQDHPCNVEVFQRPPHTSCLVFFKEFHLKNYVRETKEDIEKALLTDSVTICYKDFKVLRLISWEYEYPEDNMKILIEYSPSTSKNEETSLSSSKDEEMDSKHNSLSEQKTSVATNFDVAEFRRITEAMADLFAKKNANYGNSFTKLWNDLGPTAGLVPLHNKIDRATNLVKGNKNDFESLEDTFIDLANYAIMNVIEMRRDAKKRSIDKGNKSTEDENE